MTKTLLSAALILLATLAPAKAETRLFCEGRVSLLVELRPRKLSDGTVMTQYFGTFRSTATANVSVVASVAARGLEYSSPVVTTATPDQQTALRIAYSYDFKTGGRPISATAILNSITMTCR